MSLFNFVALVKVLQMKQVQNFTAIIESETDGFVAFCPELDVASQGKSVEEAKSNLKEAIELFFEHASKEEIATRLKTDVFITNMQIAVA